MASGDAQAQRRLARCFWSYVEHEELVHASLSSADTSAEVDQARTITAQILEQFCARWTTFRASPSDALDLSYARLALPIDQQKQKDIEAITNEGLPHATTSSLAVVGAAGDVGLDVVDATYNSWFSACMMLRGHLSRFGIINDNDEEGIDTQGRLSRLVELISDARNTLLGLCMCRAKMDNERVHDPLPDGYGTATLYDASDKRTSFQKLLLFVLDELRKVKYRRHGEECWKKVGDFHWKRQCTIKEFIHQVATKERAFEAWKHLTDPRDNDERCAKHLSVSNHPEFPNLVFDSELFGFNDGVFHLSQDIFWPYESMRHWKALARMYSQDRGVAVAPPSPNCVATQVFEKEFNANGERAERVWGWYDEWMDGAELPSEAEKLNDALNEIKAHYDTEEDELHKLNAMDFEFSRLAEVKACMEFAAFVDYAYPTPHLEGILKYQSLDLDTCFWCYIFLGRLLYPTKAYDEWQKLFFICGEAQSGKSLIARLMRSLFSVSMVGTLGSNVEKTFGLGPFWKPTKKRLIICTEVKNNFQMDQAQLQQAISGEQVSVAVKFGDALDVDWDIPLFFTGNEFGPWRDKGGCIVRRLLVLQFGVNVSNDDCRPDLYDRVYDDVGPFLRKINLMYREIAQRFCKCEITPYLSKQLRKFELESQKHVDPYVGFLESELIIYTSNLDDSIRVGGPADNDKETLYHQFKLYINEFKLNAQWCCNDLVKALETLKDKSSRMFNLKRAGEENDLSNLSNKGNRKKAMMWRARATTTANGTLPMRLWGYKLPYANALD